MATLPTFYNRSLGRNDSPEGFVDYISMVNIFIKMHPDYALKPNSLLESLVIKQYNNMLKTAPLIRPPVPEWFCGYVDVGTGEMRTSQAEADSVNAKFTAAMDLSYPEAVSSISHVYIPDACLYQGAVGSVPYVQTCEIYGEDADVGPENIDWSESFYPTAQIAEIQSMLTPIVMFGTVWGINKEWDSSRTDAKRECMAGLNKLAELCAGKVIASSIQLVGSKNDHKHFGDDDHKYIYSIGCSVSPSEVMECYNKNKSAPVLNKIIVYDKYEDIQTFVNLP